MPFIQTEALPSQRDQVDAGRGTDQEQRLDLLLTVAAHTRSAGSNPPISPAWCIAPTSPLDRMALRSPRQPIARGARATMTTDLLLVLVLILVNGLFAVSEIAIVSSRHGRHRDTLTDARYGLAAERSGAAALPHARWTRDAGLGRVPKIGDVFEKGHFQFEIVDMDGNRVDRVLVSRVSRSGEGSLP